MAKKTKLPNGKVHHGPMPGEPIIDDETEAGLRDKIFAPVIDSHPMGHGLVPRDYSIYPKEMFDPPRLLKLRPQSEWSAWIKAMEERQGRISDILLGQNIPATNQESDGYCWSYSTCGCVIALRAINMQPYVPLSPHMPAAIIKRGRNEGGWCGLSGNFLREIGCCSMAFWPAGSRDLKHDTPKARANAALHKTSEEWVDLSAQVYDINLTFDAVMTCLMDCVPVAGDFNWWSHSVLLCDPVEVEPGSFGIRLRNSWGMSWGEKGFGIIRGSKAKTDGALAIRVAGASPI